MVLELDALWAEHEVGPQRTLCKTLSHPVVGTITLQCEILLIPDLPKLTNRLAIAKLDR